MTNPAATKHQCTSTTRKTTRPKTSDKRRRPVPTKKGYKVRLITQPMPNTQTTTIPVTSTAHTPTVATASTQTPMVKSTAMSIPAMVYNLASGKFSEVPHPTGRLQNERNPSAHDTNPPPLKDIPNSPFRLGTHWPNEGSALRTSLKQGKIGQFPLHLHPL